MTGARLVLPGAKMDPASLFELLDGEKVTFSGGVPTVWLALLDLSAERGSLLVTPTRDALAKRAGIRRLETISRALTVLEGASWIERTHVPRFKDGRRTATLLRIRLRRTARKTRSTEKSAVRSEKRNGSKARKTQRLPYGERRAQHAASPAGTAAAGAAVESDATRIERERLEAIRTARAKRETLPAGQEPT